MGSDRSSAWKSSWDWLGCSRASSWVFSLSTLALDGSSPAPRASRAAELVRYADLALLALALPVFVMADLPLLGYGAIVAAWLVQRTVLHVAERRVAASLAAGERRAAVGVTAASTLGRAWFVALCVLLVGVIGEREAGLAAAVLAAILFTAQLSGIALARLLTGAGTR